ncbi:unnamed protein product [Candidula unifasciata]|uniref:Coiled-coil domain-containing protein n=1 Tax=Candidula unifasciata TaxID=100452 RepID=A0A8S4A084_9EUPU|nr:unnamed protein product [Candidula unifasciata]
MTATMRSPPTIGPGTWRNRSLREIQLNQTVVKNSDRNCDIGRSLDIVPQIRDVLASLSNEEIKKYMREVRVVVAKLRESLLETNEEIKSLIRAKEALERTLEHTRKDIQLNKDSKFVRVTRPPVEKYLECIRKRTFTSLQERSRVLDLLCHSLSSVLRPEKDTLVVKPNRCQIEGRTSMVDPGRLGIERTDPLGPYTFEVDSLLSDATEARKDSAHLRRDARCSIDRIDKLKQAAQKSVNEGLVQKVAETVTLKQHINLGIGENRHALNRAQRWYDSTERALGYTLGPVCYSDLTIREHLDRPFVRVYQRHPGTQLPEAQEVIKCGNNLFQSLSATSRNIGMLRIAQKKLSDDKRSKSAAADVDSSVVRMRRSKANHRWCLGSAF